MKKLLVLLIVLVLILLFVAWATRPAPAGTASESVDEPVSELAAEEAADITADKSGTGLRFSTTALDGSFADEGILTGYKLTMINFFEPWCPPCIAELPELEKLYENYKTLGFQIIGIYSTEEGIEDVVQKAGLSYPVLRYVPVFDEFQTGYVPTTIFVDEQGNLVGETQIGANSYEGWETLVKDLLG